LWDQPILQDSVNGHTCPPCGRRSSRLEGGLGGFIRSGKFRLLLPSINTPMGTQRFRQVFALDRLGQRSYLPPLRTALFPSGRGAGGDSCTQGNFAYYYHRSTHRWKRSDSVRSLPSTGSGNGHTCPPCGRRFSRPEGGWGGFMRVVSNAGIVSFIKQSEEFSLEM